MLISMKMFLTDGLEGEVLKTLLFALGLPDPLTSLCVIFSCGDVLKDKVYVPPLPENIDDMKDQITAAINMVNCYLLRCVQKEFSHWFDVVHAAGGSHIEHL